MHTEYTEDKELIELAAKAIGWKLRYNYLGGRDANQPWNPLEDDGDALRLSIDLKIDVEHYSDYVKAWSNADYFVYENNLYEPYVATRKAITRMAAEIGRNMK